MLDNYNATAIRKWEFRTFKEICSKRKQGEQDGEIPGMPSPSDPAAHPPKGSATGPTPATP
eukprot:5182883-Prorocentrum_lima.AAC.1